MAFTDFKSIAQVQKSFGIRYIEENFIEFCELVPDKAFLEELEFSQQNIDVFTSEASRCENIIYPILREVYKAFVERYALWSHKSISSSQVLNGTPDYMIATKSKLGKTVLGLPVVVVVEAKQNNFTTGWGQCLAELVAVQMINKNEAREGEGHPVTDTTDTTPCNGHDTLPDEVQAVYGIVTDGELWQFGKLMADIFTKHRTRLTIDNPKELFGAIGYLIQSSDALLK